MKIKTDPKTMLGRDQVRDLASGLIAAQQQAVPKSLPMQFSSREQELPIGQINQDERTIEVVFTTGAAVRRHRWIGWDTAIPFDEVLEVSSEAINMERLNTGAPALDSHSIYTTYAQVGVVDKAWIAAREGRAMIRFPDAGIDERADRMFKMVSPQKNGKPGIIRNISVGYRIDLFETIPPKKEDEVEKRIITRWTPHEISFVTVGADAGAHVRSADQQTFYPVEMVSRDMDVQEPGAAFCAIARMTMRQRQLSIIR